MPNKIRVKEKRDQKPKCTLKRKRNLRIANTYLDDLLILEEKESLVGKPARFITQLCRGNLKNDISKDQLMALEDLASGNIVDEIQFRLRDDWVTMISSSQVKADSSDNC